MSIFYILRCAQRGVPRSRSETDKLWPSAGLSTGNKRVGMNTVVCEFEDVGVSLGDHSLRFSSSTTTFKLLKSISFSLEKGQSLGVIGESGSGKSTILRSLCALVTPTKGQISMDGCEIDFNKSSEKKRLRQKVQMVFQDPISSLSPRRTARQIVEEPLRAQKGGDVAQRAQEMLEKVGISRHLIDQYPHEFSLGQCQRIGIARALVTAPELLLCDEPVSALDRSTQAQILNLLQGLQNEMGFSLILVSHDLRVVKKLCNRILVLVQGYSVEEGPIDQVLSTPMHPYTKTLVNVTPDGKRRKQETAAQWEDERASHEGQNKDGCPYALRCPKQQKYCFETKPPLERRGDQISICHFPHQ